MWSHIGSTQHLMNRHVYVCVGAGRAICLEVASWLYIEGSTKPINSINLEGKAKLSLIYSTRKALYHSAKADSQFTAHPAKCGVRGVRY
jgi:hypothetical protein